ncbi:MULTISPECIES: hypothetical protein [unclassified Symbiopectobacterium]|uniref:hypothetical protein n=1 Tax=unclassified Symbiopectobacterium TaxID=2794573 RepID=UPI002225F421|nr:MULTISPECIES: hypothetical protein [unclassified Symbiopectobacterium]MCW2473411.1 hypothetical protein [Candidatus Symbiopectobacterium sp. NZEC151]MCW2482265.1 hypothetical protein [Candidatus Symbiopectobacterium sp. NZEC135]
MFTVKQIINNATSLYEVKAVNIARPGSEQWKQAFELADKLDIAVPDTIEWVFPTYKDEGMTQPIVEEQHLSVDRQGGKRDECIAIICSDLNCEAFPDLPTGGGIGYQFLYRGDQLYVTNSHGATIETVK